MGVSSMVLPEFIGKMRDIRERKADVKKMLDEVIDRALLARGFTRRKDSITYRMKLPDAVQEIVFSADYSPHYKPGAEAHIYPRFVLKMPDVQEMALKLVGGDKWLLADAPDLIMNLPIEFAAPKEKRPMWYTFSPSDSTGVGQEICKFVDDWGYDFIKALQTPADLIRAHEASDYRIIMDDNWHIRVAAAYLLKGDRDNALRILEGRFRKPDAPKRYSVIFETLPNIEVNQQDKH